MGCLIVGGGAAGLPAALHCRQCWPGESVTLIDGEREVGYYRPLLPQFMVGQMEEEKLFFWRPGGDPLLKVRCGVKAQSLDRANQTLFLETQEKLKYERLILAPGGRPLIPPICAGNLWQGIFPIRDLTTVRDVREWLSKHREIVILGGGLVGVKTAVYLRQSGLNVSLVEKEDHLLPQVLTPGAARVVEDHLQRGGIRLFLGGVLEDIQAEKGSLKSVQVGGQWLPCDTLLVAVGSTPNVGFLEGSGLLKNGELVVSPALQTRDEKIYAAGDAMVISNSKGERFRPWTWPQAVSQGKLAAANLYRFAPHPLSVLTRPNSMNLHGLSIVILGAQVPGAERISSARPAEGIYRELFLLDGRVVGGALVGDISGAGPLHALMASGREVSARVIWEIANLSRVGLDDEGLFRGNNRGQWRQAWFLLPQEFES